MGELRFPAIDPVLLDLPGPLDVRWYGLMYIVAFVAGQWILKRLARSGFFPVPEVKVVDLVFALIFGVIVGGRLGFFLFYEENRFEPPYKILKVWEGGLSFHGGMLGVLFVMMWFSHRNGLLARRVGDCCAIATPPGIFAVRMANFINGELYGRVTDATAPFAMRFPTDPVAGDAMRLFAFDGGSGRIRSRELAIQYAYERSDAAWQRLAAHVGANTSSPEIPADTLSRLQPYLDWEKIKDQVPLRHPSQLYEGACEGLLLGTVLMILYWRFGQRIGAGGYTAIFLLGYGISRFCIEYFRQPDPQIGFVWGGSFTRGQQLCVGMIIAGVIVWLLRKKGYRSEPAVAS